MAPSLLDFGQTVSSCRAHGLGGFELVGTLFAAIFVDMADYSWMTCPGSTGQGGRENGSLCVETLDPMRNFALLYRIFYVSKRAGHI